MLPVHGITGPVVRSGQGDDLGPMDVTVHCWLGVQVTGCYNCDTPVAMFKTSYKIYLYDLLGGLAMGWITGRLLGVRGPIEVGRWGLLTVGGCVGRGLPLLDELLADN